MTAVMDARGRVIGQAPQFKAVSLESRLVPRAGLTPYMRWRDGPLLITVTLLLLGLAARRPAFASTVGPRGRS